MIQPPCIACVHLQNQFGDTPLMYAADQNHPEGTSLIENGTVVDKQDNYGWTALMMAAFQSNVELLLKYAVATGAIVVSSNNYILQRLGKRYYILFCPNFRDAMS